MAKKKNRFKPFLAWGLIFAIVAVVLIVVPVVAPDLVPGDAANKGMLYGGIGGAFIGMLFLLASAAEAYKMRLEIAKKKRAAVQQPVPKPIPQPVPQPDPEPIPMPEDNVQYFPSENAYDLVSLGPRQSIEEKFAEIAKMDRAQFIVYVAKLFSIKGYQVKYTPVVDNYDIDIIVEKMDVSIAVGCILTNKILSDADIRCVAEGRRHYPVNNVMALTNMYFDRTALNFAKQEKMSLVDHNILAEDFMK